MLKSKSSPSHWATGLRLSLYTKSQSSDQSQWRPVGQLHVVLADTMEIKKQTHKKNLYMVIKLVYILSFCYRSAFVCTVYQNRHQSANKTQQLYGYNVGGVLAVPGLLVTSPVYPCLSRHSTRDLILNSFLSVETIWCRHFYSKVQNSGKTEKLFCALGNTHILFHYNDRKAFCCRLYANRMD